MSEIHIPGLALSLKCQQIRVMASRRTVSGLSLGSRIQLFQTDFTLVGFEIPDDAPDFIWLDLGHPVPSRTIQTSLFDGAIALSDEINAFQREF